MQFYSKTLYMLVAVCVLCLAGCSPKKSKIKYPSPNDYDLSKPIVINLKGELDEISGMHFYPKDSSIFAIIDEAGYLYKIFVKKKVTVEKWKFSRKADFEDIALVDSVFFALQSNGSISSFKFSATDSVQAEVCGAPFTGKNEFESLYYDEYHSRLVLLCKDCKIDKNKSLTAYSFNPVTKTFADSPFFVINVNLVAEKLNLDKMKLKPSAAAINPLTKELYIVSAVNKALVITDRDGNIKEAYKLDPAIFKQPEGLTFTPWGDLLISNEVAETGSPNILIFKYKARRNAKG